MKRAPETVAAWLLGVLWILPLAYAGWTAFHPREYSARFVPTAPLTLGNFVEAWNAAPFARYFLNTVLLVTLILIGQLGWRRVDRQAEARESKQRHTRRGLHVYQDEHGMVVLRGRLEPEMGALLLQALGAAREALYQRARGDGGAARLADPITDPPTPAQQRADALALVAETALSQGLDPGAPGDHYQVVVHVDEPALADPAQPGQSVLEDGAHVPAEPVMWLPPLPVVLKRSTIARGGTGGRSRYWCRPSPSRNLTRGVAWYPVVWPQRAL